MNNICAACNQNITTNTSVKCSICEADHHQICVNATFIGEKQSENWLCPSCRPKTPCARNTNTTVRMTTTPAELDVSNVNTQPRAHKRTITESPGMLHELDETNSFSILVSEIRYMRSDMSEVKDTLKLLYDGMQKCNARLDMYETRILALEQNNTQMDTCISQLKKLEDRINDLENNNTEIASLNDTIGNLKDQLNQQMQSAMRNEIEIIGIEEANNENLYHTVLVTAAKLGVQITTDDIEWTARAGLKKDVKSDMVSKSPRPVIVRLLRRAKKDQIIKASKSWRSLSSTDIDVQGPIRKIFVNEHLTKENRTFFREARIRAKDAGYKYCWTTSGRIFVRKSKGKPATLVKNNNDLDQLLSPVTVPLPILDEANSDINLVT